MPVSACGRCEAGICSKARETAANHCKLLETACGAVVRLLPHSGRWPKGTICSREVGRDARLAGFSGVASCRATEACIGF
eukprot:14697076-Alexandrium_andersonii.AAC.1